MSAASVQATIRTKSRSERTLRKGLRSSIDPPRSGAGNSSAPDARRNRTGGSSTIRQPVGVDLDRAPRRIAEIEVELAVQAGDANMNRALDGVEMRLGLDHVERRLQRLRIRRAIGLLEEGARQPAGEALRADGPGLAMAVDVEIGVAGSVRRMEQIGGLREPEQDIGLRLRPRAWSHAAFLARASSSAVTRQPVRLSCGPQRLEGGAIGLLQIGERSQNLRRKGRARDRPPFSRPGQRADQLNVDVDNVRLDADRSSCSSAMSLQPLEDDVVGVLADLRARSTPRPRALRRASVGRLARRGDALATLVVVGEDAHPARLGRQDQPADSELRQSRAAGSRRRRRALRSRACFRRPRRR